MKHLLVFTVAAILFAHVSAAVLKPEGNVQSQNEPSALCNRESGPTTVLEFKSGANPTGEEIPVEANPAVAGSTEVVNTTVFRLPNAVNPSADVSYRGASCFQVTGWSAVPLTGSERADVAVVAGGLLNNHITIRITARQGTYFHYRVIIRGL